MKTKLFTLLLAVAASVGTMFADGTKIGDLYYNLNATDQTAEVTYELEWNENNYQGLTTANIPASVTYNSVTYSVTSIGGSAFRGCSGLTSVTIPNSVTSIGDYAFYNCSGLTSVNVASDNSNYCSVDGVVFNKDKTTLIQYPGGKQGAYTIPNSVTSIGDYAFGGCTGLTSVTIPNSVTSIGNYAFNRCADLTSVTIPNSVTSIRMGTFRNCTGLTSVTIPNSVTSIGLYAFNGCSSLTSVTIPNSVTSIEYEAFSGNSVFSGCSSLTSVTLNSNTIVGKDYGYNSNIKSIFGEQVTEYILGDEITSIGLYAFYGCSSLTSVTIPNSVTSIGNNAFQQCSSLSSVTIPSSVTSIGKVAFYDCSSLTSIEIPNSVTRIDGSAFAGCSSLTSVESPALLFNDAFSIFHLSDLEMPSQIKYLTINAGTLTEEGFDRIRASYRNLESVDLANAENTELSDEAFKGCYNLQTLRLPAVLKEIKYMAVAECVKLQAIDIPATVESIGDRAFEDCRSMATVTFAGNAIQSIGCWAFYNCHALQNIVIPEGVTEIGDGAFYGCTYLADVLVPASARIIGDNAFALCSKMAKMTVKAIAPPAIAAKTFEEVSRTMPVYVPVVSVSAYKADPLWGQLNIIGGETGVDALQTDALRSNKILRNGEVLILRDGKTYTIQGVEVR